MGYVLVVIKSGSFFGCVSPGNVIDPYPACLCVVLDAKHRGVTANNDNPHVKVHVSFQSQGCSYHFDSQQSHTITKFGPTMLVRAKQIEYAITCLFMLFCF